MWNVYNASHTLVATYSTQGAAAAHVACWPALYYSQAVGAQPPTELVPGPDSPPAKPTRTRSDG